MPTPAITLLLLSAALSSSACGGAPATQDEAEPRAVASTEEDGTGAAAPETPSEPTATDEPDPAERVSKTELARRVFEAVQAHDFERYREHAPRPEDFIAALPHLTPERADELHNEVMAQQRMMFEEAIAQGERRGIVWADAVFREAQQNGSEQRPNVFIVFEHGGEPYSMKMDDCLDTERGWVVGDYLDAPQHGESHREPVD